MATERQMRVTKEGLPRRCDSSTKGVSRGDSFVEGAVLYENTKLKEKEDKIAQSTGPV